VAADLFALGASFYQTLTGRLPYQKAGEVDLLGPVVNELQCPSEHVAGLDPMFDAVCQRALDKNPTHRFQSAEEFALVLESWLADHKTPSMVNRAPAPPEFAATAGKRSWKHLARAYGVYALPCLLLVILLIVNLMGPAGRDGRMKNRWPQTRTRRGSGPRRGSSRRPHRKGIRTIRSPRSGCETVGPRAQRRKSPG
jgi:serine/threonine protein kinase